ncbi:hypothetical protein niasHT_018762 [Heterodera trifolii]|uniref:DNA-directed DNA polymerase n=1 Tax=Heterodera trifolii TaxID=157864 RepID=A0ABD2LAZ4_9BILA
MEPFLAATTIASLAMAVFRQHHLRPNTMVHTPEGGFLRGRRASVESRRFFTLLAAVRPDLGPLRTARWSIGEAVVGEIGRPHRRRRDNNSTNSCAGADDDGFRLDCVAYRHPPLRPLCIEFNGCYMHGCRECYPDRHMLLAGGRSAELLWARTQQRAWELAELHGMEVLSVWECQFRRTLRTNTRLRKLYKERCVDVPGPLDLRKHALFGGRVEPFWLLHKCAHDEEIVYIDISCLGVGRFLLNGVWEHTECRSRNTRCEAVEVALNGWSGARRPDTLLAQCIAHLLDRVLAGRGRPLRIGMSCQPPKFASPYHIPHRAPEQNTAAAMAAELERLAAQSAGGVDLFGGTVLFRISAVWPLERNSGAGACAADEREARGSVRCRSFFPVVNPDDAWCLARAVVLGLADRHFQHLYGADSQQATAHLRTFWLAQHGHGGEQAARQLLNMATLPLDQNDYGVADAQRLQQALDTQLGAQQVRLVIFEREHGCRVLWKAPNRAHFNICLLLQRNAHYGYIQRPQQLFRAKQYCVECERPVHRRSHPLGCRAVCGLCLRYDALHFPCRREADTPQGGLFCAQCRFVFPNADCFAAHRQCVDPPPALGLLGGGGGNGGAVVDRRRGRPYRSMCEERRLCAQCNVVVWARSGAHHCRRQQQQQQQHVRAIATASTAAPMAPTTAAAAATVATVAAVGQQQQQQQHHCQKCGGPHDASRTPHFVQPKQFARQCQWQQHNTNGIADDVQGDQDEEGEDNESDGEGEEEGADATRGQRQQQRRDNKAVRFIFWDVECAQERVVQQQQQQRQQQILQEGVADEWAADGGEDDDDDAGGIVICERCIAHGVELEREPLRRAPRCQCGVPWRGANRRRWCSRIGEQQFDDSGVDIGADELGAVGRQLPPDGLNPRRLRFFCDGEPGTGRGAMEQFVDFLLHTGPKGVRTVMLAHNGGRYDIHLLLEELQRRGERPRRAVQHGLRVYMLELRGTHQRELICKDSLNYFHCALATLPRTFGLRGVPDKPFFPYHHIHARNLDVELPAGTLPPPAAYDPDRMRAEQRERFMEWYAGG